VYIWTFNYIDTKCTIFCELFWNFNTKDKYKYDLSYTY